MTDPKMPPMEHAPSPRQWKKPTYLRLLMAIAIGAPCGFILGIAVIGLIDIWSQKFRPDLRQTVRSLRPYFSYATAALATIFAIVMLTFYNPELPGDAKDQCASPSTTDWTHQEERET